MAEKKTTNNLVPQTLKKGLYTQIIGSRILHFKELDSTMDRAAEEAERGTPDGTVILCDSQTRGRGRFNRVWVSPAGNLILSVVLRPSLQALPFISVLAALAVTRTIETETNLDPVIKWAQRRSHSRPQNLWPSRRKLPPGQKRAPRNRRHRPQCRTRPGRHAGHSPNGNQP